MDFGHVSMSVLTVLSVQVIKIMEFVQISADPFASVIFPGLNRVVSFSAVDNFRIACDQNACHLILLALADSCKWSVFQPYMW